MDVKKSNWVFKSRVKLFSWCMIEYFNVKMYFFIRCLKKIKPFVINFTYLNVVKVISNNTIVLLLKNSLLSLIE